MERAMLGVALCDRIRNKEIRRRLDEALCPIKPVDAWLWMKAAQGRL